MKLNQPNEWKASKVKLTYVDPKQSSRLKVSSSAEAYAVCVIAFDPLSIQYVESFHAILLNHSGKVLGIHEVSRGGISSTVVDIRNIAQAALLANASKVIVCHNHPSGNRQPSKEDINMTNRLRDGLKMLEIQLWDHLIVTADGFLSFSEEGLM